MMAGVVRRVLQGAWQWTRRGRVRGLLMVALSMVAALLLAGCDKAAAADGPQVYIISPHGSDIRREFGDKFAAWHQAKYGTPAQVTWLDVGGTSQIMRYLDEQYKARNSAGCDIMFGGGSGTFDELAKRGYLVAPDPALPAATLAALPADIHGSALRGPGNVWFGATMSYFGIVINKDRLAELHMKPPVVWKDLAKPEYFGRLSLADPSKSGSVRTCYEMLLQQYGWEAGWPILVKMFANVSHVEDTGSNPADQVGSANDVAGVVIDFFARKYITRQGARIVGLVIPEGGSAVDADPIAVLKGAPNPVLASHFIEFVLSPAGQKLWVFNPGTPGGPEHYALARMTVLPELYTPEFEQYMTDPYNPFTAPAPLKIDRALQAARSSFLGDLLAAALIANHDSLAQARHEVLLAGDPPALLKMFDKLPFPASDVQEIAEVFHPRPKAPAAAGAAATGPASRGNAASTPAAPSTARPQANVPIAVRRAELVASWRDGYAKLFGEIYEQAHAYRLQH